MPNDPQGVEDMRGAGEPEMDDYALATYDIYLPLGVIDDYIARQISAY